MIDSGPSAESEDKRRAPRARMLVPAKIVLGEGLDFNCTLRNLSDSGARLSLDTPAALPAEFSLQIPSKGLNRRVRIAWRRSQDIGVQFLSSDEDAERAADKRRIRELEAEVRRLKSRIAELSGE